MYSLDAETKNLRGVEVRVTPGRWVTVDGQTRGASGNELEIHVVIVAVLPPNHRDPEDVDQYEHLAQQLADDVQNQEIGEGYVTDAARPQLHGRLAMEGNELFVAPIQITMRIWE